MNDEKIYEFIFTTKELEFIMSSLLMMEEFLGYSPSEKNAMKKKEILRIKKKFENRLKEKAKDIELLKIGDD